MASLRAQLINRYIRSTFRKIPLVEVDPPVLRAEVEKRTLPFLPKGVETEWVSGSVRGEWQRPEAPHPERTIYYLHGGGYVFGSPKTHRSLTFSLAKGANTSAFSLDYRLAPEHPCPAAVEDAVAGFDWLLDQGRDPAQIYVGGDSAGGGLTLALIAALKARGGPLPGGAFLYSPWTDLTLSGASIDANAESDVMFQQGSIKGGPARYAGDLALDDPRVSPLFSDFNNFPKTIVFVSSSEMLFNDSTRLAERMKAAGVDVDLTIEDGLVHVWPLFTPLMPEAKQAVAKTVDFIAG